MLVAMQKAVDLLKGAETQSTQEYSQLLAVISTGAVRTDTRLRGIRVVLEATTDNSTRHLMIKKLAAVELLPSVSIRLFTASTECLAH